MAFTLYVLILLLGLVVAAPAPAAANPCTGHPSATFSQPFPSSGAEVTRWSGSVCSIGPYGLVLGVTRFRPSPSRTALHVMHDARVAEIYVYYHDGMDFFDIHGASTGLMVLNDVDCPPARGRRILGSRACLEVRDRGLAYRTDSASRRGEELVVWGVNVASNYKYVIEWRLRDDGVLTGRVGATGVNLSTHHDMPHIHLVTWRLDVDLGGAAGDMVHEITHLESSAGITGRDTRRVLTTEGGRAWSPTGFRYWLISDPRVRNGPGNVTGFRVGGGRYGTARHGRPYTASDVWITRSPASKTGQTFPDDLLAYANGEDVHAEDVVVWYSSGIHHVPRDEDDGATQIMWVDVTLTPENLFDSSPLP